MLFDKIKSKASGIVLYGITPPKTGTDSDKISIYASNTVKRVSKLDIDGLVVYDVQDESERIAEERPFPYIKALDPLDFTEQYLSGLKITKIIYRPAGKYTQAELANWLARIAANKFNPVFVGLPSPDHVPVTSLNEAYEIWSQYSGATALGAVAIPERHAFLRDEDVRIMGKAKLGVSFFVTQCVFDVNYSKDMIDALVGYCKVNDLTVPTIIFTLTSCGSDKTLAFLEWLGIYIPPQIKIDLISADDILASSMNLCRDMASELAQHCQLRGVPFGFNIESVAIRKLEIEASIQLVKDVCDLFYTMGLRTK